MARGSARAAAGNAPGARRAACALALLAILALSFAVRALGLEAVFPGDGEVVFQLGDGPYHARLALYAFTNFPAVLLHDPYLNFPHGSVVWWPPLFDFAVAATARALGSGSGGVETVLAWSTPVAGAATTLVVFVAARRLAGGVVALGAAALHALCGASVIYSNVGNGDHHAAVALLGALLLALSLEAVRAPASRGRALALGAGLGLARAAMLLTWSGSLLYVVLADGGLLLGALLAGRRDLLRLQAWSALGSAALAAPYVAAVGTPVGGLYSAVALSRLHLVALAALALLAGALAALEGARPGRGVGVRLARLGGLGLLIAGATLALPGVLRALGPGVLFVGASDDAGWMTAEQMPLFPLLGRAPIGPATHLFGWLAYAIPLAPPGALLAARRAERRAPALLLALWSGVFGALCIFQIRYGNDFAAPGAIAFALGLAPALGRIAARSGPALAAALGVAAATALSWPCLQGVYLPLVPAALGFLRGAPGEGDAALRSASGSLARFAREVRQHTPPTRGFLDARETPEYGVLSSPNIGHAIRWGARRPVPADGHWAYLDRDNYFLAAGFDALAGEAEALAAAERLRVRFVVTDARPAMAPGSALRRLHREDGLERGAAPRWERFRLVTEGPRGGVPLTDVLGVRRPRGVIPYKLFEIVAGAQLEVRTEPGAAVEASLVLDTPLARHFVYRAGGRAGADGLLRLRVPYASEARAPVRARGRWRVRSGERETRVEVPERTVVEGEVVAVDLRAAQGSPRAAGIAR